MLLNEQAKSMIIIADDLTGANDTGVQFARQGMHTEVLLEGTTLSASSDAAIIVIDTNTRASVADKAYRQVQQIAKQAQAAGFLHYYKKLDSTLRGNIGVELQAILDLHLHDFAFVMPAFPKNGRTTVGGNHLLHGIPLSATEIARDQKTPVSETFLPELLRKQTGAKVGHIGITDLCQGQTAITAAIKRHLAAGCTFISCDAWLDEHFLVAARAVLKVSDHILWAGSAGLAECLPQLFGWKEKQKPQYPTLVVAGSISAITRDQVTQLLLNGYELIEIDVADYLKQPHSPLPCLEKALALLEQGKNIVLASGYHLQAIEKSKTAGTKHGMSAFEVSEVTAKILGETGAAILRQQNVAGVILTGGDTASAVCQALGVTGIRILEEIAPAIPLGKMKTPEGKSFWVITKAGAFGNSDALVIASQKLTTRRLP
jgi:D-threonate/D-erythronate kinase